jgi:hypothetical protein
MNHRRRAREGPAMDIKTVGIDLAKNMLGIHGVDALGRTILQRALRRRQLLRLWHNSRPVS